MPLASTPLVYHSTGLSSAGPAKRSKGQVRATTSKAVSAPAVIHRICSRYWVLLPFLGCFWPSYSAVARFNTVDALQKPQPSVGSANGTNKSRIAVLGASGYTGEEVIRLMALHPSFAATVLTGESQAGKVRAYHGLSSPLLKTMS